MKLGYDITNIFLFSIILFLIVQLVMLIPLPGTTSSENIDVQGQNTSFKLINQTEIKVETIENNALGQYNILKQKVTIATDTHSMYGFLSTCSHEVKHVKTPEKTGEELHKELNTFAGYLMIWDWEAECINLVDNRLNI